MWKKSYYDGHTDKMVYAFMYFYDINFCTVLYI